MKHTQEFRVMAKAQTLRFEVATFETEQEATDFCEAYGWELEVNGFIYDLYID